jgi:hypothetical protein
LAAMAVCVRHRTSDVTLCALRDDRVLTVPPHPFVTKSHGVRHPPETGGTGTCCCRVRRRNTSTSLSGCCTHTELCLESSRKRGGAPNSDVSLTTLARGLRSKDGHGELNEQTHAYRGRRETAG